MGKIEQVWMSDSNDDINNGGLEVLHVASRYESAGHFY